MSKLTTILILTSITLNSQNFNLEKLHSFEQQLDDVIEILEPDLVKLKLAEVENNFDKNPNELNKVRLGLICHEVAFSLTFIDKTDKYKGYADKSFTLLTDLYNSENTTLELMPIISSYRASALSLKSSETKKLSLLSRAFDLFEQAINNYSKYSPRPEFLRASVSENLPFFMWKKRSYARKDFESIIVKQQNNKEYADFKVMSFTYWAWAKQHQGRKYREKAIEYLNKAIKIDPNYLAGRKLAEELKMKLVRK